MTNDSKHIQALPSVSLIMTDWICLRVAQMPRSQDLAIFVVTTDEQMDRRTDRPNTYPCACTRGNDTLNKKEQRANMYIQHTPYSGKGPIFASFTDDHCKN